MINGFYKPGDKLKEKDICQTLGVSRTPLREAFRILQSEGLLTYSPHHGVVVTPVSQKDIENLWEIRYMLEVMAIEKAMENMSNDSLSVLNYFNAEFEKMDPNDKVKIIRTNSKFHMYMINLADNERLGKLIKNIWVQIQVIQSISFTKTNRFEESCKEHNKIIFAINNNDKKLAAEHMRDHLEKGKEALIFGLGYKE